MRLRITRLSTISNSIAQLFSPSSLFSAGEQGAWYDPSDVNVNWRRNLLTYTEEFDNAAWIRDNGGAVNPAVTANFEAAPDGTNTADRIVLNKTGGVFSRIQQSAASTIGTAYTFSVWLRTTSATSANVGIRSDVTGVNCVVTSTWQRFSVTGIASAAVIFGQILLFDNISGNDETADILAWGAQLELGNIATSYQRIVTPEITYLADIQSQPILWQDSAGTTPVTAVEQPVGLMLDKSKGLVLGSELRGTGVISTVGSPGTLATFNTVTGEGTAYRLDGSNTSGVVIPVADGRYYLLDVQQITGPLQIRGDSLAGNQLVTSITGRQTYRLFVPTGWDFFFVAGSNAASVTFIIHSVRELPGNHAFQTTAASRPVLSARYNLLTRTEQFDDAAWAKLNATITANSAASPNGTITADKLVEDSATGQHRAVQSLTLPAVSHRISVYLKAAERSFAFVMTTTEQQAVSVNLITGAVTTVAGSPTNVSSVNVGDGWWLVSYEFTPVNVAANYGVLVSSDGVWANRSYAGSNGSGILIWGADLRASNSGAGLPQYQRVTTATDYDAVNFPKFLRFDGVDDGLQTNAINFTGTDKMTVVAGVRKLSDAAVGTLVELSAAADSNNGGFFIRAPWTGVSSYDWLSRGTNSSRAGSTGQNAPVTDLITGISDISADSAILRVDGVQAATSTMDQGTGNYGNYPLFIGRRAGTSLPFNGLLYGLVIHSGRVLPTQTVANLEQYMSTRMPFTKPGITTAPTIGVSL